MANKIRYYNDAAALDQSYQDAITEYVGKDGNIAKQNAERRYNYLQLQEQRQYDTPENQLARLLAAGVPIDQAYQILGAGSGSGSGSAAGPVSSTADLQNAESNQLNSISGLVANSANALGSLSGSALNLAIGIQQYKALGFANTAQQIMNQTLTAQRMLTEQQLYSVQQYSELQNVLSQYRATFPDADSPFTLSDTDLSSYNHLQDWVYSQIRENVDEEQYPLHAKLIQSIAYGLGMTKENYGFDPVFAFLPSYYDQQIKNDISSVDAQDFLDFQVSQRDWQISLQDVNKDTLFANLNLINQQIQNLVSTDRNLREQYHLIKAQTRSTLATASQTEQSVAITQSILDYTSGGITGLDAISMASFNDHYLIAMQSAAAATPTQLEKYRQRIASDEDLRLVHNQLLMLGDQIGVDELTNMPEFLKYYLGLKRLGVIGSPTQTAKDAAQTVSAGAAAAKVIKSIPK